MRGILTEDDCGRDGHIGGVCESLHYSHGDLVCKANAETKWNLSANVPSLRGVDIHGVKQGRAHHSQQPTHGHERVHHACLAQESAADHCANSIERQKWKGVHPADDGRLSLDALEIVLERFSVSDDPDVQLK